MRAKARVGKAGCCHNLDANLDTSITVETEDTSIEQEGSCTIVVECM